MPYDKGWTVTVNGKETDIIKANIGFMAVPVGEGVSEINFTYKTPGLLIGAQITLATLVLFIIYIIVAAVIRSKKICKEVYPEGEDLIAFWCREQAKQNRS